MNGQKKIIAIVDGQGGGIGRQMAERLKRELPDLHLRALGTNSMATARMLKAGANDGATGENAIVVNAAKADVIVGAIGIVMPNAILGELTPRMAEAISSSDAVKVLIPIDKCSTRIAMPTEGTMSQYLDKAVELVKQALEE